MNKIKRILSMLLTVSMLATVLPLTVFADSVPSEWAISEVALAEEANLVTEKIKEDYQKEITREEFCELVVKLFTAITNINPEVVSTNFTDIVNEEVSKAYGLGIVYGFSETEFAPYKNITRQEICTMLVRCIDKAIADAHVNDYPGFAEINSKYADATQVADWALPSVSYAIDNEIIKGVYTGQNNTLICPLDNTTREQAVLMIWRVFNNKDWLSYSNRKNGTEEANIKNDTVKSITVDYTITGKNSKVQINDISNYDLGIMNTAGRVGSPVEIKAVNGKCVDATITFAYDEKKLSSNEKDLGIAYYDETEGRMVLTDANVDTANNTISVQTNHFSNWVMVDELSWYNEWRKEQLEVRDEEAEDFVTYDVVLAIDASGSMDTNDPESLRKTAAYNFIKALYGEDEFSVISFTESCSTVIPMTKIDDITDWGELQEKISNIGNNGGTNITGALTESVKVLDATDDNSEKMIILLTDGRQDIDKNDDNETIDYAVLEVAKENNISIYTIGLGKEVDADALTHIASECNGEYFKAKNADELIDTYQNIKDEKIGISDVDDDYDGIADVIEVAGMRNQYGMILKSNPKVADSDKDTLTDGNEVGTLVRNSNVSPKDIENGLYAYVYYRMNSDPTDTDSDNDELLDPDDEQPWINNKNQPISEENISVSLNGRLLHFDEDITESNGKIYLPISDILDEIGVKYAFTWDDKLESFGEVLKNEDMGAIIAGGNEILFKGNSDYFEGTYSTSNGTVIAKNIFEIPSTDDPKFKNLSTKNGYSELLINGEMHSITDDIIREYVYYRYDADLDDYVADMQDRKVYVTPDILNKIVDSSYAYDEESKHLVITAPTYFDDKETKENIYNAFMNNNFDIGSYSYANDEINNQGFWESYLNDEAYNFATCFKGMENLVKSYFVTVIKDHRNSIPMLVTKNAKLENYIGFVNSYADTFYYYDTTLDYKDAILDLMSEIKQEEIEELEVPDYIKDSVKGMKEANDITDEILKENWGSYWNKRGVTDNIPEIGKDMRFKINKQYASVDKLGKGLKNTGNFLKLLEAGTDVLEFVFTDYSNSVDYLYTIKSACANNEAVCTAIDEIIEQYTTDYITRLSSYGVQKGFDFALDTASGKLLNLIPYYGLAKFATDIISKTAGWDKYAERVDRIEAFNAINLSISMYYPAVADLCYADNNAELFGHITSDELKDNFIDLIGTSRVIDANENKVYFDTMNENELKDVVWNELKNSFVVYKASMEKGYRIFYALEGEMPASDRDLLTQLRHSITLDEISRVYIVEDRPQYAKDAFYVK